LLFSLPALMAILAPKAYAKLSRRVCGKDRFAASFIFGDLLTRACLRRLKNVTKTIEVFSKLTAIEFDPASPMQGTNHREDAETIFG